MRPATARRSAPDASWPVVSLGEVVDLLAGFPFKSERFIATPMDGVPLVKGENVSQGRILWSISKYWPAHEYSEHAKFHLLSGDVILAMDRPWVPAGLKWAFIREEDPKALLVQRCARLRSRVPKLHQDFLRYVIGGRSFEDYIRPITTGVNVPHISGAQILAFRLALPPVAAQRRIAGILSAYDDLIENCERRIRVLDEMARALYREWFVLFRYPGHEKAPLIESQLGPIPKGWHHRPLSDLACVNERQVDVKHPPPRIRYVDISSVSPGNVDNVTEYDFPDAPGRARRIVRHGDVLWSCVRPNRRSHALLLHPDEATIASTGFAVLTAKKVPYSYLYVATTTDEFTGYLEKRATGAAYPAVTSKVFEDAPILTPEAALLERFARAAGAWFEVIALLQRRVGNLRKTRDLLLPRLLSGQLAVEDVA